MVVYRFLLSVHRKLADMVYHQLVSVMKDLPRTHTASVFFFRKFYSNQSEFISEAIFNQYRAMAVMLSNSENYHFVCISIKKYNKLFTFLTKLENIPQ